MVSGLHLRLICTLPCNGSLKDTTAVFNALRYRRPVWTYKFRDFGIFRALEFWTPEPK